MVIKYFIFILVFFHSNIAFAGGLNLSRDSQGWTIFTPSSDSRIMYVSASGNDSTGVVYSSVDSETVDPFKPSGTIQPFATYAAAFSHARDGYPDWILLKRGDVFYQSIDGNIIDGRSATEPSLVGAYGDSGLSPKFLTGAGETAINKSNYGLQWAAFSGISFYSYTRDPDNAGYIGTGVVSGIVLVTGSSTTQGVLFEGCSFRFYSINEVQHLGGVGATDSVYFNRCSFLDNYAQTDHSQGLYTSDATVIIDECIFDHNGWFSKGGSNGVGEATMFNHNMYLNGPRNVVVKNSVSVRPSSIHTKSAIYTSDPVNGPTIIGNLLIDGEVGVSLWGNYALTPGKYNNITISDNVLTNIGRSKPTGRTLSWGVDLADIKKGTVSNNIIMNQTDLSLGGHAFSTRGYVENVQIENNILHNLYNIDALNPTYDGSNPNDARSITFERNKINMPSNSGYLVYASYDPSLSWAFSGNDYYSNKADGSKFNVTESDKTNAQWVTLTGDNSTFAQPTFPDSTRSVETYMQYVGETNTIDAFIDKCRAQDRYNWNPAYTAPVVNQWIKAGFGMGGTKYKNVKSITQETP